MRRGLILALSMVSCGGVVPRARAPAAPAELTSCELAQDQDNPLLVEWSSDALRGLEAHIGSGAVAVAFSGCDMRVIAGCTPGGNYRWQRTTSSSDAFVIRNEDELYARLPLGAAALRGQLRASSQLDMRTTVAGQMKLEQLGIMDVPKDSACAEATHIVGALSLGAFSLSEADKRGASGTVDAPVVGEVGGSIDDGRSSLRSAGDPAQCDQATDDAPAEGCKAPLQAFLWELPWARERRKQPAARQITVASTDDVRWDVFDRGHKVCVTPCKSEVPSDAALVLVDPDDSAFSPDDDLDVNVFEYPTGAPLEVQATSSSPWLYTLSYPVMFIGTALMFFGLFSIDDCTDDSSECGKLAPLLGGGAAGIGGGITMLVLSFPTVDVKGAERK